MIDKDDDNGCATRNHRNIFDVIYTDINGIMWRLMVIHPQLDIGMIYLMLWCMDR